MPKTPSYRQRKGHAQALVTLTDSVTKKRRDYWLGEIGSPTSRERYHRVIAEWEALDRRLPDPGFDRPAATESTLTEGPAIDDVVRQFWRWAQANYRPPEVRAFRSVLRLLRQMEGSTPTIDFGPNLEGCWHEGDSHGQRAVKSAMRPR